MFIQVRKNTNTEVTRLSQPSHKVTTMLFYNLVTILYFETIALLQLWWQGCHKFVQILSQGCHNFGIILPQFYHKVMAFITKLATTLYSMTRVLQGCYNLVIKFQKLFSQ